MARVVAFIPDLLFGSRVQAMLLADGHQVDLVGEASAIGDALTGAAVLLVDLTDDGLRRAELVKSLSGDESLKGVHTLGFYSHVDIDTRRLAEGVGFDLLVPRSRMAREGAELVARLVAR